ncbi:MAG: aldolase [Geminicoccaceae bacterium]|nr:aldolase [Geminicoccaceae bacterium]
MVGNLERSGRVDLAAALRYAVRLGLHEGVCNHFSLALKDDGSEFLVNPQGLHWSELRASDLVRVRTDGTILSGGGPVEDSAFHIHGRMHRGRPAAKCILHTHMPYATALTSIEDGRLLPLNQNALRFTDDIAYDDDYGGLALDSSEGDRLAAALGDKRVLFMANHGVAVVGHDVASAFDDLYYLERACQNQVLAMSTGRPLKHAPEDEVRATRAEFGRSGPEQARLHFAAIKRLLDRDEPDYAD